MNVLRRSLILALGAALSATPALAQQHDTTTQGQGQPQASADQAMMAGMEKMNHDMNAAALTGNADRDFVAMMIPHHQGAVDMAQVELRYGKSPDLRRLATRIVAAQNREIALMRRWQATHAGQ